jgi:hypothetical protein
MGWVSGLIGQRTFKFWALATVLVVSTAAIAGGIAHGTTASCANSRTLAGSAFEIDTDANLVVNTPGCIDWLSGGTGTGFRSGVLAKNDKATGSGDDSFGQGTAEDNPNPTIVDGSIPPNKSDLKAFGVYAETGEPTATNPTGKNLALFWSRVQNPSGTTNMDFELNKVFCDGTATNCANNGTKSPLYVTPKRSVGDKLITYDLSRGGTVPTISIRTWGGSAWGTATVISGGAGGALGSVNTSTIPSNQTGGVSGGLTTALGQQDPYTFGEASISFGQLFSDPNACGKFGSAYLKSRSSDSFTAEIKDFVAPESVNITNCAALTTNATPSATLGNPISDTAHLTDVPANAGGSITFKAYSDSSCSTLEFTSNAIPVNGPGDYTSNNFTPTAAGTYYWTASYTGDANTNTKGISSSCGDANESSVVGKNSPSITTTLSDDTIAVGDSIHDSATLSGASANAGGTVTYTVYTDSSCSQGARDAGTKTVTNGTVPDSNTLQFDDRGDFYWQASYSGDINNGAATSVCTSEHLVVGKAPSTLDTAQSFYPNDEATLSATAGGAPTGNVTFTLFDNSSCTGTPLYGPVSDDLDGNGKATTTNTTFAISADKTVYWKVEYPGDAKHLAVSSCTENTVLDINNGSPVTSS